MVTGWGFTFSGIFKAPAIWNKSALSNGSIASRLWARRYHRLADYRLTPHAAARIAERLVPAEWLDAVLHRPQSVLPASHGREERQGVFERDGKRVLLRVICEADLVITAMLTSKLEKYGGLT